MRTKQNLTLSRNVRDIASLQFCTLAVLSLMLSLCIMVYICSLMQHTSKYHPVECPPIIKQLFLPLDTYLSSGKLPNYFTLVLPYYSSPQICQKYHTAKCTQFSTILERYGLSRRLFFFFKYWKMLI